MIVFALSPVPANAQAPSGKWAWVGGSSALGAKGVFGTEYTFAPGNTPPARTRASSWTDSAGRMWLFGGDGLYNGNDLLSDLWVFDPAQGTHGEWAWMGGIEDY